MIDTTAEISQVLVDGVSVPVAQGAQGAEMKVQTFDLPFVSVGGSDTTYYSMLKITNTTLINDVKPLISEKRNSNKLISISLKYAGIEAPYIVSAINSFSTDQVGFLTYISNSNGFYPIYYVLEFSNPSYLEINHQGIPTEDIQAILSQISYIQVVVKYME